MRAIDINFSYIIIDEKSYKTYENILVFDISYKPFMGSIPFRIKFDKIDGFIKTNDEVKYLALFDYVWFDNICYRIKYLTSEKSGTTDNINIILEKSELIYIIL